jgi:hypothetical protein
MVVHWPRGSRKSRPHSIYHHTHPVSGSHNNNSFSCAHIFLVPFVCWRACLVRGMRTVPTFSFAVLPVRWFLLNPHAPARCVGIGGFLDPHASARCVGVAAGMCDDNAINSAVLNHGVFRPSQKQIHVDQHLACAHTILLYLLWPSCEGDLRCSIVPSGATHFAQEGRWPSCVWFIECCATNVLLSIRAGPECVCTVSFVCLFVRFSGCRSIRHRLR